MRFQVVLTSCLTACCLISVVSDYEASLKKEGGIPEGPVLESLLAGETLDKKVETKEEESMSECQVCPRRLVARLAELVSPAWISRYLGGLSGAATGPPAAATASSRLCERVITCDGAVGIDSL